MVAAQVRDLVHPPEQFPVVADDQHDPGPRLDRRVQPPARVPVQVVGRLVEDQDGRPPQEQPGQRGHDRLAAGQPANRVVQADVIQAKPGQPAAGLLAGVPVVADRVERRLAGVTRLDRVDRVEHAGDAEQRRDAGAGVEGEGLRQVADVPGHRHRSGRRPQAAGDQREQGGLARAVHPDQAGPAGGEGGAEAVEDATPVRPGETELAQDNGGPAGTSGHGKTRRHARAPERGHGRAPPRRGAKVNLRAPSDSPSVGDETPSSCPREPGRCNGNSARTAIRAAPGG